MGIIQLHRPIHWTAVLTLNDSLRDSIPLQAALKTFLFFTRLFDFLILPSAFFPSFGAKIKH